MKSQKHGIGLPLFHLVLELKSFLGCMQGEGELVQVVRPPAGAQPGDPVYVEAAGLPSPDAPTYVKQLKGDHWRKIAAGLKVAAGQATFEGQRLVVGSGPVTAAGMPDGADIH